MLTDQDKLIQYIKAQTVAFLEEMDDFYPFGAAITADDELKPLAAHLDDEELSVQALLSMLEAHIMKHLADGRFRSGAIALAVTVTEHGQAFDAVQIRFHHNDTDASIVNFKYLVADGVTQWL